MRTLRSDYDPRDPWYRYRLWDSAGDLVANLPGADPAGDAARLVAGWNLLQRAPEARDHAAALDSLIDGQQDELAEVLTPVRDFLRQLGEQSP